MAVRALTRCALALLLLGAAATAGWGCFGPKLYLGGTADGEGELLHALVALYLKEKTGVETVSVDSDKSPLALLQGEEVDLVFSPEALAGWTTVLQLPGGAVLVSGPRPQRELQFTTILPALERLGRLLDAAALAELRREVDAGRPPKAAVRQLLQGRGWI